MKYRDILGFSKLKKKVIKEQAKPRVNKVLKNIKQELNESSVAIGIQTLKDKPPFQTPKQLKEVGMASDIKKYTKVIDKNMENLTDSVREMKNLLMKNGAKKEAQELGSIFVTNVGKFRKFIKIKFIRMIRNLI